eukprot:11634937-Alexandrium_andersonii.AAC.1
MHLRRSVFRQRPALGAHAVGTRGRRRRCRSGTPWTSAARHALTAGRERGQVQPRHPRLG